MEDYDQFLQTQYRRRWAAKPAITGHPKGFERLGRRNTRCSRGIRRGRASRSEPGRITTKDKSFAEGTRHHA